MSPWRLRIGTRLLLAFALLLLFLVLATALSIWRLHSVDKVTTALVQETLVRQQLAAEWQSAAELNATRTIAIAKSDSLELADYFTAALKRTDQTLAALEANLLERGISATEVDLLRGIGAAAQQYRAVRDEIFGLKAIGRTPEVELLVSTRLAQVMQDQQAAFDALASHYRTEAQVLAGEANQVYRNSLRILIGVGLAALLAGGLLAVGLTRGIVRPLRQAAALAQRVAHGDLTATVTVQRDDEIGDLLVALRQMQDGLASMARDIQQGVRTIEHTLSGVADDNHDLARRTGEQAEALRAISVTMQDITAAVGLTAQETQQANALAASAATVAHEGGAAMTAVVRTMGSISASSRKIADIIGVIDGIAFQTNILALNAAVEAARAGEHGRGFAVVAAEVRSLSQRSAQAAREIGELIQSSVTEVNAGATLVNRAGTTMQQVVTSIGGVSDIVARIRGASERQTSGLLQIGAAIEQIDHATQQNAELVQHAVRAIDTLAAQSGQVDTTVERFRLPAPLSSSPSSPSSPLSSPSPYSSSSHPPTRKREAPLLLPA